MDCAYSVECRQLYTAWKNYNSLPPLKQVLSQMLPGPETALDDAKRELGKLEANCFGKVRRQVVVMTAAQSLWNLLNPGTQRKTLCSTCVQSLADYEFGLPAKMAAVLQNKTRPSSLECLGRHVRKPLFQ